jgi:hypothetical protein
MSKKKPQASKYCRIFQWVEAQDPAFAAAINRLCLEGALSPGGRGAGVTFLYPEDKAYRDEIIEKAYTDEADEAEKLVCSLIIPDALLTGADFSRRAVGSRTGVKYGVESADASRVKLTGGVELTPARDFQTLAKREGSIAIWLVSKGRLPLSGEAYKAPAARGAKTGGRAVRGGNGGMSDRAQLALTVECEFDRCMKQDRCRAHNPYLARVVSLLNYLRVAAPETYAAVLPVLDYEPIVSFYLLLEPCKTAGAFLIPDSLLFGPAGSAWNGAEAYANAVEEYKAAFSSMAGLSPDPSKEAPYAFRDHAAVAAQVDAVRQAIGQHNPRQVPQLVHDAYSTLVAQNSIQGLGPVLPDATLQNLASGAAPGDTGAKKLWQDEFRFIVHEALQTMRQLPAYASDVFANIVRDIHTAWPGNQYVDETRLANLADLRSNVEPRTSLLLLLKFVNSTDFLYTPAPPEVVGGAWGDPNDPTSYEVYNRNAVALGNLGRIQGMARASGLSPQTLVELQVYARTHGRLPAEVLALAPAQ